MQLEYQHICGMGPSKHTIGEHFKDNELKDGRHKFLNLLPYTPGPLSVPQPLGYTAHFPYKRTPGVQFVLERDSNASGRSAATDRGTSTTTTRASGNRFILVFVFIFLVGFWFIL
ncbi:hypothetical protein BOTCAL_0247g00040 [Botryotinia calthae]|uniref:Uncharacterized protein n=1 Tax=Botryotinia calthae TaxID=38488 RepID=A0A4Y8CZJ5_9HELO|nr:hypothetical protein BOTCAL_0247g00040 [Botryotinia calthae]